MQLLSNGFLNWRVPQNYIDKVIEEFSDNVDLACKKVGRCILEFFVFVLDLFVLETVN